METPDLTKGEPVPPPKTPAAAPPTKGDAGKVAAGSKRRRTVLLIFGGLAACVGLWFLSEEFFAYTDDAYVTSDIVAIAPEVTGPIVAVHVHDNQLLKAGDLLVSIDPQPFQIAVAQCRATLAQAQAQLPVDQAQLVEAQANLRSAQADLQFADTQLARSQKLSSEQVTDRQSLDLATKTQRDAASSAEAAQAAETRAESTLHLHERAVEVAQAALDLANWRLARTEIRAPADGPVSNLRVRVGNMAVEHQPMLTIVDGQAWRVYANYKERFLHHFHPGMTAWVWLDAAPGHWYRAHIEGMSHVISRDESEPGLVPYVAPTVNWIRLTRRIPVRIELENPPPNMHLFMGSDARTFVWY
jgi:membrane fusion protein, multidrug efflux system